MTDWTYFAGGKASRMDTLRLVEQFHILWRSARNSVEQLIPNVGLLSPGDTLHFVFRERGHANYLLRATIGTPTAPVPGAAAIDRVGGAAAAELANAGYLWPDDGVMEVIHLGQIERVESEPPVRPPANQNAIYAGLPVLLCADEVRGKPGAVEEQSRIGARARQHLLDARTTDLEHPAPQRRAAAYFDRYLAVDWSASSSRKRGRDSIWIAEGCWNQAGAWEENDPVNCGTRHEALRHLLTRLSALGRTLVGFDFAFGYPRGLADRLPGAGEPWMRTGAYLDRVIEDTPDNKNNRHRVAATINDLVGSPPGPFWGSHEGAATASLTSRRVGIFQFPHSGLDEFRATDRRVRQRGVNILSVWKINQGVSVGGQTLIGIPYLMRLRAQLRAHNQPVAIWPFETGWTPAAAGVTIVEIFPTLVADRSPEAEIKDRYQVRQCIACFASLDSEGRLTPKFARPDDLDDKDDAGVRGEEGWILLA